MVVPAPLVGRGEVPSALNGTHTTRYPLAGLRSHEPCNETKAPPRHRSGSAPGGAVVKNRMSMVAVGAGMNVPGGAAWGGSWPQAWSWVFPGNIWERTWVPGTRLGILATTNQNG